MTAIWNKADIKRTPAEWAFKFILNHPEVDVVLSGMNEMEHINENIRIATETTPD
ncbi:aldo/keto reductase, partial [Vallitalea sediminicola]